MRGDPLVSVFRSLPDTQKKADGCKSTTLPWGPDHVSKVGWEPASNSPQRLAGLRRMRQEACNPHRTLLCGHQVSDSSVKSVRSMAVQSTAEAQQRDEYSARPEGCRSPGWVLLVMVGRYAPPREGDPVKALEGGAFAVSGLCLRRFTCLPAREAYTDVIGGEVSGQGKLIHGGRSYTCRRSRTTKGGPEMGKQTGSAIVSVRGAAPKKGQLPAGLISWLKANGRMKRGVKVVAAAGATRAPRKSRAKVQAA